MTVTDEQAALMGEMVGAATAATSFMVVAVVTALVERGAIDPFRVAAIADEIVEKKCPELPPLTGVTAETALRNMAELLRAMATMPPGAGRA